MMASLVSFRRICLPISCSTDIHRAIGQCHQTSSQVQRLILLQQNNQLNAASFFGARYLSSKGSFSDLVDGIKATGKELKEKTADGAEAIKETLADMPGKVKDTLEAVKDSEYSKKGKEFAENIAETVTEKAQVIGAKTAEGAEKIKGKLSDIPGKVSETFEKMKDSEYTKKGQETAGEAVESVKKAMKDIGAKVTEGAEKLKDQVSDFPEKAKEKYDEALKSEYAKKGRKFVSDAADEIAKKSKKVSKKYKDDDD